MSTYLRQQALTFIHHLDRSHHACAGFDWDQDEDDLISAAASACRAAIIPVAIEPLASHFSARIARPDESIDELRERCCSGIWRSVGQEFSFPDGLNYCISPDVSLNSQGTGFGEWTWQINRHNEWLLLAQQYHSTDSHSTHSPSTADERCAQAVSTWLRNWLEQCPLPDADYNAYQGPWRTIEIGIRLGSVWPQVLSAFHQHPAFTDVLFLAWLQSYAEQAAFVYQHRKQNNWLLMEMNGLMHAGVQIPMHQDSALWRQQASDALIAETQIQFLDDGMQRELSPSYHAVCFTNYMRAVAILQQGQHPVDPRLENCIRNMLKPCRALVRPNGVLFDFQDSNAQTLKSMLKRCPAAWYADGDAWFLGTSKSPPSQRHHLLDNAGYVVLRSGYAAEDVCVAFDAGPFGDAHQHEDKLSLQVHAYGRDLIGEAGIVDYNDSPERHYSLSTLAHSTAIIDGLMQNRKSDYKNNRPNIRQRAVIEHDFDAQHAWASAIYDEGYGPDAVPLLHHKRCVILKSQTEIHVIDTFSYPDNQPSNTTHTIEILFHCAKDDAMLTNNRFQSTGAGANVAITWACAHNAITASLCCGSDGVADLRGWAAPDNYNDGLYALTPRPCLTLSLHCSQETSVTSIIQIIPPE